MPNLFQLGDFVLNSGAKSSWKLDCDALTDEDIRTLAQLIREIVPPFSSLEGIPQGGLRLAEALRPFISMGKNVHLIVDDILTTGGSLERAKDIRLKQGPAGRPACIGVVIFARGPCPYWVRALFQMPAGLWIAPKTRS